MCVFTDQRLPFISHYRKKCGETKQKKRKKKIQRKRLQRNHLRIDKTKKCVNACLDKKNTKNIQTIVSRGTKTGNNNFNVHLNIEAEKERKSNNNKKAMEEIKITKIVGNCEEFSVVRPFFLSEKLFEENLRFSPDAINQVYLNRDGKNDDISVFYIWG